MIVVIIIGNKNVIYRNRNREQTTNSSEQWKFHRRTKISAKEKRFNHYFVGDFKWLWIYSTE